MAIFLTHVNTVLGKLREAPVSALSTDNTTEAWRAQEAVRRAVSRVWNAKQWSFKIRSYQFDTSSSTALYYLRGDVGEPFSVLSDTDPYRLQIVSEKSFDKSIPNPTETGAPVFLRLLEMTGSIGQPTTASTVAISSSSSSDTTQKVLVKGLISDSYVDYEELSLAGTGSVSSTKIFSTILAITKSDTTAGSITVVAGATTLAVMAPAETVVRRRAFRFYPAADSTYTITVKHFGLPPNLTHAYEDTEIPPRWDYVVDQLAFAFALQAKGQEQAQEFQSQFSVATKYIEDDMAREETIASEEIITPSRWGDNGAGLWANLPNGYTYPQ